MLAIKKAIFPVAGLGSRFLPATKANPKEMLPIVDKPLIQYAVEEAIRAGISHLIFIVNSSKHAIEEHFDKDLGLEAMLQKQGKNQLLELVREVSPANIQFTYVRQPQSLGLGHAILCAEHVVENEPFAVILPDDLLDDVNEPCLSAMANHFAVHRQSIVAVQPVPWNTVDQYGVVEVMDLKQKFASILGIIEKPERDLAPSNLAAIGRYIFTPEIFEHLKDIPTDKQFEVQLTPAIQSLLSEQPVVAYNYPGTRFDCGSKLGYLKATVELGLRHPEIGLEFEAYLRANMALHTVTD